MENLQLFSYSIHVHSVNRGSTSAAQFFRGFDAEILVRYRKKNIDIAHVPEGLTAETRRGLFLCNICTVAILADSSSGARHELRWHILYPFDKTAALLHTGSNNICVSMGMTRRSFYLPVVNRQRRRRRRSTSHPDEPTRLPFHRFRIAANVDGDP